MTVISSDSRTPEVVASLESFLADTARSGLRFFNEAEMQHEMGVWLRSRLAGVTRVYFERPASSFFPAARRLVKKEIDLVVSYRDESLVAIELKCPRSGRVPETMFDACRDLQFLEQLKAVGFCGGLFVMHVEDSAFYESGIRTGIYSHFRSGAELSGRIGKPTGAKDEVVELRGRYSVDWRPHTATARYWLQDVAALQ